MAILIVKQKGKRDMVYHDLSHAEASKLVRGMFAGYKCKIIDKQQRRWDRDMRSYCDRMQLMGHWS